MFRVMADRAHDRLYDHDSRLEVMRLTHELLGQLLSLVTRRGTPFTLLGIKVNSQFLRVLISVIAAAIASACLRAVMYSGRE